MVKILEASERDAWRYCLNRCRPSDVCQLPEYHLAYESREGRSTALLWVFDTDDKIFCYPFLKSRISFDSGWDVETDYYDISSVYGYSGPLSNSGDRDFLRSAWEAFDRWAAEQKIVLEFVRFSCYADNSDLAHPATEVIVNRPIAVSHLPKTSEVFLGELKGKTRNMVRRAEREGLKSKIQSLGDGLTEFRDLYRQTMERNQSTDFFAYDDAYYAHLASLDEGEIFISTVYSGEELVSAAVALVSGGGALYHLGANRPDFLKHGAGNLCLYRMGCRLIELGVSYLTMGGGRTTAEDDPLFKFKERNATGRTTYKIGKRILDKDAYEQLVERWVECGNDSPSSDRLIFYR